MKISLKNVKKKYCVTYYSAANDCCVVQKEDGPKRVILSPKKGPLWLSVNNDVVLVTTVEDKINKHTIKSTLS